MIRQDAKEALQNQNMSRVEDFLNGGNQRQLEHNFNIFKIGMYWLVQAKRLDLSV